MRIGLFGHVGNQNLGDEALVEAVLQQVHRRYPHATVVGFTKRPSDTRERHHIPAYPIRRMNGRAIPWPPVPVAASGTTPAAVAGGRFKALLKRVPLVRTLVRAARLVADATICVPAEVAFLARAYRSLRGTDLLLVAGSGQLNDYWEGPWGFPFTLFKWALLARATGTRVAFLSLGAGPLRTRLGKFFIKQTLRLADYRSYRDDDSQRCVEALGVPGQHAVVPDLVFGLDVTPPREPSPRNRPIVGINPMPFFDDMYYPERDPYIFGAYVQTLAAFADWLVEREFTVRFFATQLHWDQGVIDRIRALMRTGPERGGADRVIAARIGSFDELVATLDSLNFAIATRYHGTLFSLIRLKPVISIAYQRKSLELMRQVGQAEYAIEIQALTLDVLRERFLVLERHRDEVVTALRPRLPELRGVLETQYDRAFSLLGSSR